MSGTVTVTPTAEGCVGTPTTFDITVQPSVTLQAEVNTASVCINATAPVIGLNIANGVAPYLISYTVNGGATQTLNGGTTNTLTVPVDVAGTFVYSFTSVQSSDALQCVTAVNTSITVTVNDLPTVEAGEAVQICPNSTVLLNATGSAVNYVWSNGATNGDQILITNNSIFEVTGTDANGCSASDEFVVTVVTPVQVNAGANQQICIGEQVVLEATMDDQSQGAFTWTNGVVNGQAFTPTISLVYTVTATDVNGCTTTDEVEVVVNNLPIISAGPDVSACTGNNITLTGSGANGGTYTWSDGVINGQPFMPSVGTTTYTVTGTDLNGCTGQSTVNVFIQDSPVVSFTAVQNGFCAPVEVVLTNASPIIGQNCTWYVDGIQPISGCGPHTIQVTQPGDYSVTLVMETVENGCVGSITQTNVIRVDETPVANFVYSPEQVTEINNTVEFTNQSYGAVSYAWNFGNGQTSALTNPVIDYGTEVTTYNVMLTAVSALGCKDTTIKVIRVEEELIFFIPNTFTPDGGVFNEIFVPVFVSGYDPYDYVMYIFNRWGEMVFETHDVDKGWNGKYGVDGPNVPDGTYVWKIEVKTKSDSTGQRSTFTGHVNVLR